LQYCSLNSRPHACQAGTLLHEPLLEPFFVLVFFKIEAHKLFPWAGFAQQSSWSLPHEWLGLQVWVTSAWLGYFFVTQ
jgi:hypothetical protein